MRCTTPVQSRFCEDGLSRITVLPSHSIVKNVPKTSQLRSRGGKGEGCYFSKSAILFGRSPSNWLLQLIVAYCRYAMYYMTAKSILWGRSKQNHSFCFPTGCSSDTIWGGHWGPSFIKNPDFSIFSLLLLPLLLIPKKIPRRDQDGAKTAPRRLQDDTETTYWILVSKPSEL